MKTAMRITAMVLALITAFSVFASALDNEPEERRSALIKARPLSSDINTMVNEFTVTKASNGMKYAYYNPVIDERDDTKYPVVIYAHGLFHAWTDTSFRKSGLTYWACREMQNKFEEGGAHLIMPKIPEFSITALQTGNVYGIIKEYINNNLKNVDESQIYIMGGSAGGGLAWRLIIAHPGEFAAAVILCSTKTPTASEVSKIGNMPIWEVSANTDPLVNIAGQTSTWNTICGNSNVKGKCRWSTFAGSVTLPDGSHPGISHFLAKTIGYDFCLFRDGQPLPGMSTRTAEGNSVGISYDNGIIYWLQNCNDVLEARKEAKRAALESAVQPQSADEEDPAAGTAEAPAAELVPVAEEISEAPAQEAATETSGAETPEAETADEETAPAQDTDSGENEAAEPAPETGAVPAEEVTCEAQEVPVTEAQAA